jgi:hypothetical protein
LFDLALRLETMVARFEVGQRAPRSGPATAEWQDQVQAKPAYAL